MNNNSFLGLLLLVCFLLPCSMLAQSTVTGKVIDEETGDALSFVNVLEKGTTNGVVTDEEGNFSITLSTLPTTLEITYLGYATKEVAVTNDAFLTIAISESSERLDEVVVTGLASSTKRKNLANTVATVSSDELVGVASAQTLDGALSGKLNGVVINSNSGAPGGGISVKLRGVSSLFGQAEPLYIIDGVYLSNSALSAGINAASQASSGSNSSSQDNPSNRVADINPEDIEKIEVLKGASAAAIYGSRASAGVIIITTKKGKSGDTKYSLSQEVGFSRAINLLGLRDWTEQRVEDAYGTAEAANYVQSLADGTYRDYEDILYGNTGAIFATDFNVRGGNGTTNFYSGISHLSEEGIMKNTGYEKLSLRLNLGHKVGRNLKLNLNTNYIHSDSDRGFTGNANGNVATIGYTLALFTRPWGNLFQDANGVFPNNPYGPSNPLQTQALVKNEEKANRFIVGGTAELNLYSGEQSNLKLILRGGLDTYTLNTTAIFPRNLQWQVGGDDGIAAHGVNRNRDYNLSGFLVHNYTTSSNLNFTTQAGMTAEFFDLNRILVVGRDLTIGETTIDNTAIQESTQFILKQEDSGFFVQEEINYDDKLIATIGVRGDKSSNNSNANKLYYYPKASLAANIHNFTESNIFSQIKPRIAYGEAGSFPRFGSLFSLVDNNVFDGFKTIEIDGQLQNLDLEPERQKELEFGLDLGVLNGRVGLEATYYIKNVDDALVPFDPPSSSGYDTQWINGAELQNRGFEIALRANPIDKDDFQWNTTLNFWRNRSEVKRLDVPAQATGAFGTGFGTFFLEEGATATQIVASTANGLEKVGDAEPDFQTTWSNTVTYKNFDLSFLWHWKKGGDNVNLTLLLSDIGRSSFDYDDTDLDPAGQIPNGDYRQSQLGVSSPYVEDASYIRLREVGLSYRLPKKVLSQILNGRIEGAKIGFSGRNLVNIFDYRSYDPEVSNFGSNPISTGIEVAPFPSSKRILFNLTVNF